MALVIEKNDNSIRALLKEYFRLIDDKEINRVDEEK